MIQPLYMLEQPFSLLELSLVKIMTIYSLKTKRKFFSIYSNFCFSFSFSSQLSPNLPNIIPQIWLVLNYTLVGIKCKVLKIPPWYTSYNSLSHFHIFFQRTGLSKIISLPEEQKYSSETILTTEKCYHGHWSNPF